MLRAIIFDCDGVIVDSEPLHFKAFRQTLETEGIALTANEYYSTYLAMDDKGCFEAVLKTHHRACEQSDLKRLILHKKSIYQTLSHEGAQIYPGVVDFVKRVQGHYKLAIASGAFRSEIKAALDYAGIRAAFPVIVSAQDVKRGKPDPEAFLTALEKLNVLYHPVPLIRPEECVVIEDSHHGIKAASLAGMKTVAVTSSYARSVLEKIADCVVDGLSELGRDDLEKLCKTN